MSRRDFAGPVKKAFSRHLDSRGDGTGVNAATGLYADSVVTFNNTTNIVVLAAHGYAAGDGPFTFTTTGSLPAELALATDYYVGPTVQAGDFEVSLTRGGAVVPFTDNGTVTTTLVSPFKFYLEAQAGEILRVESLLFHVEDAAVVAAEYGGTGGALTNGISVQMVDSAGVVYQDLTDGDTIKTNSDLGKFCYDTKVVDFGAGNDFFQARWDFASPIRLKVGEQLVVTVNDDLSGLVDHTFVAQGTDEGQWTHSGS